MKIRHLLVPVLLSVSSCSGSDTASDTGENAESAPADTEAVATVDATLATEVAAPVTDAETPASTEGDGGSETETTDRDGPSSTEDGLVIDGPAQVRPSCDSLPRGVTEFTLDAGGGVHDVRVFVPTEISSDPSPVVLNWHGLGSNGTEQAIFSGYEALAEQEGFIVVHPTGLAIVEGGPNSWEIAALDTDDRDDLAFADALIDTVVADWCGDADRIYSTGMSNGGFFTSELVCNRADRIAAAVSVAGLTHWEGCDPQRTVPYIAFHGTDDDVVPFAGTGESTLLDEPALVELGDDLGLDVDGLFSQVVPDEFAEFAADARCDPEPVRTEETPEVISYAYGNCDDGVPMTFYEIVGGGHTWPDSPLADQLADFGFFTDDISATADGWAFMSQYAL